MLTSNCWPNPCLPWEDPELERLRRLKQQREVGEEKARLREWLRRHGMPQTPCCPPPFPIVPLRPAPLPCPMVHRPCIGDVLRRIG